MNDITCTLQNNIQDGLIEFKIGVSKRSSQIKSTSSIVCSEHIVRFNKIASYELKNNKKIIKNTESSEEK